MSDEQPRLMSIRAYSRLRACSEGTVRYHIRKRAIRLVDGRIDVKQADLAWARRRHQSRSDPGAQMAAARIRRARARLELMRDEVAELDAEYAERSEAVAQFGAEADYVISALKAMPAIEAERVGRELGISAEKAEQLLADFVQSCLSDVGDLHGQLVGIVDRV